MFLSEEIKDKWQPVMEHEDLPKIEDATKRAITLRLLENQEKALQEANVTGANVNNWDPILISLVRRTMPQLMAYDTIGVQPMSGPTGLIFAMKSHYTGEASTGAEALTLPAGQPDVDFSGDDGRVDGLGAADPANQYATADGEALGGFVAGGGAFKEMSFSIEKSSVTAETRALKAKYSLELAQDLKAIHGLDAESELSNILSAEILAEINREVIELILSQASAGATAGTTLAGTFDVSDALDNRGARWGGERYKSLLIQINREANLIAKNTGRGRGNWILCSADVASALDMVAGLAVPSMDVGANQPDIVNNVFAGTLGGKYKVYIDQFAAADSVTVGYKGANMYDAGLFYCPYVPLQLMKSIGEEDFQPRLGFKTRYGLTHNPFASGTAGANPYFRKFTVTGL